MERPTHTITRHSLDVVAVLQKQNANENGLTEQEVNIRLSRFDDNRLPEPARRSWFVRLFFSFIMCWFMSLSYLR